MFCPNCGKEISDGVNVCPHCNKPVSTSAMLNEKAKQTLNFATEKAQSFTKDFQENIKSGNYKNFLNKKNIIVVAAVLLVFIIAANLFGGRKSIKPVIRELEKINTADARAWSAFVRAHGINAITADEETLLFNAALSQNESLVRACLKAGADPNRITRKAAPVIVAVNMNNIKIAEILLKAKANIRDERAGGLIGKDAMSVAVEKENVDMIKLLLPYYKKAKLLDNSDSDFIWIPSHFYHQINHDVAKVLLEGGLVPSFYDMETLIDDGYFFSEEDSVSEYYWKNVITKFCPDKRYKNKIVDDRNLLCKFYGSIYTYTLSEKAYERFCKYAKYMTGLGYESHTDAMKEDVAIDTFLTETGLPYLETIMDIFIKNKMSLSESYLIGRIEEEIKSADTLDKANEWFAAFKKIISTFESSSLSGNSVKDINAIMEAANNPSSPFIASPHLLTPYTYYKGREVLLDIKNEYDINCVVLVRDSLNSKSAKDVAAEYDYDIILIIQSDDTSPNAWIFSNYDDFFPEDYEEDVRYWLTVKEEDILRDEYENKYHFAISNFIGGIREEFYIEKHYGGFGPSSGMTNFSYDYNGNMLNYVEKAVASGNITDEIYNEINKLSANAKGKSKEYRKRLRSLKQKLGIQ